MLGFSRPGKPTDNAFIESFNGKFRAECLNTPWFMSLDDAKAKMGAWRRTATKSAARSASGHKTPIELMKRSRQPACLSNNPGNPPAGRSKNRGHVRSRKPTSERPTLRRAGQSDAALIDGTVPFDEYLRNARRL